MSASSAVHVNAYAVDPALQDLCHSWWSCQFATMVSDLVLLGLVGASALAVLGVVANLRAARDAVEEERSRTAAERDAFRSFARCVSDLTPDSVQAQHPGGGSMAAVSVGAVGSTAGLAKVRASYRETVMAVAHYDEEYGESVVEHMAAELGEDVASSVESGSSFSPLLQRMLVARAEEAMSRRDAFLGSLDREAESLHVAGSKLAEIDGALDQYREPALHAASYEELVARWDRLDGLADRCGEVLDARQARLRDEPLTGATPSFSEYLYDGLPVDHPVLAAGTALLDRIDAARQTLVREAVHRV